MNLSHVITEKLFKHHVYGVSGNQHVAQAIEQKCRLISKYVTYTYYEKLKIDDVRGVKLLQNEKSTELKIFIISFHTATLEAQNALLKILEEPSGQTIFIIVSDHYDTLLPTLHSRISETQWDSNEPSNSNTINYSFQEFNTMNLQERFDWIKTTTDKKKSEASVRSVWESFFKQGQEYAQAHKNYVLLESLIDARSHISKNGSSIKMILEYIAITLS